MTTKRLRACVCLVWIGLTACSEAPHPVEPVRAVRTIVVGQPGQGNVGEFAAEIKARTESRLGFRVGGKLITRQAELGQTVKRGQVLARIDPQDYQLGSVAARAGLAAAQANFNMAWADAKRFKQLRDQGFISSAELERHETARIAAQAQLDQARAQSGVQSNQASYTTLSADADGVITGVLAEPGQVVGPGTPVVILARDGMRDAVFSVPEDRLDWIRSFKGKVGAVQVRRWGAQETLAATLREVAAAADPVTRTFLVKADVGRAAVNLGQTATVVVQGPRVGTALRVPLTALFEKEGKTSVWVLDPKTMTVHLTPIQVLDIEQDSVTLTQGLVSGDEVVDAGVHVLIEGQKVQRYHGVGVSHEAAPDAELLR